MSQQTILRWNDSALAGLFEQLLEEHRRRAERLYGEIIARAARGTPSFEVGLGQAKHCGPPITDGADAGCKGKAR